MSRPAMRGLALWAGLFLSSLAWVLATPVLAAPDEFAHVTKAAAVVRGQLIGDQVARPGEYYTVVTAVQLPEHYGDARGVVRCFVFRPEVPASCARPFTAEPGEGTATVFTSVGRYPPLTYAVVGLPSLWLSGAGAVYGMRIVGAILCTGLLAVGATAMTSGRRPAPALAVATVVALTPMVVFLCSTVNPSGLEVSAGFALWGVALGALRRADAALLRRDMLLAALLVAVLVNTRASSPLFGALIGVVLVIVADSSWRRAALRERRWVPAVVVGACASVAALVWLAVADPNGGLGGRPAPGLGAPLAAARAALLDSPQYLRQMIGVFGYLDTSAPLAVYLVWTSMLAGLGVLALAVGDRRERLALVLCGAVVLLLPVVVQIPTAERLGLIWQGRYLLAFAVGLPLLCGAVLHRAGGRFVPRPAAAAVVAAGLFAHLAAFVAALRRSVAGTEAPLLALSGPWQPPLGSGGVLLLALCGLVLLGLLLWPGADEHGPVVPRAAQRRTALSPAPR